MMPEKTRFVCVHLCFICAKSIAEIIVFFLATIIKSLSSLMQQVLFPGDYHYDYPKLIQWVRHRFMKAELDCLGKSPSVLNAKGFFASTLWIYCRGWRGSKGRHKPLNKLSRH